MRYCCNSFTHHKVILVGINVMFCSNQVLIKYNLKTCDIKKKDLTPILCKV